MRLGGGDQDVVEKLLTDDGEDKYSPRYSLDGANICYVEFDTTPCCWRLYKVDTLGGAPSAVTTDSISDESPRWTPDGSTIITAGDAGIYKISVSSGTRTLLATGVAENPVITPNGSKVIYEKWNSASQNHYICRVNVNGLNDTCLISDGDYIQPDAISDTSFVAIKLVNGVNQLCRVIKGVTTLLSSGSYDNFNPRVSNNLQSVTYEKKDQTGTFQVYRLTFGLGSETRVTDGTCDCLSPVYAQSDSYIAYSKWPPDGNGIDVYSKMCYTPVIGGGSEVAINTYADAIREHPCWSPNGHYIVYEKVVEGTLLQGEVNEVRQLAAVSVHGVSSSGVGGVGPMVEFSLLRAIPNPFASATTTNAPRGAG